MNREEHIFTHLDDHIIAFFGTALAIKKKEEVFKVAFHGFLRKRKYVCVCGVVAAQPVSLYFQTTY